MELKIKHLAPYLPYGLKVKDSYNNRIGELRSLNINGKVSVLHKVILDYEIEEIKPILRPLSDLTKEIEVNGEKFVPLVELLKIKYESWYMQVKGTYYEKISHDNTTAWFTNHALFEVKVLFFIGDEMSYPEYWIMNKLAEWHIDFNGLIDAGLAIDINTLPKNNL